MRIPINLASQPLENLRPWRTAVALAALAAVAFGLIILQRELRSRSEFRSQIEQQNKLEESLRNLRGQQQELESWLTAPQAAQIRERSGFLNSLILRKGLSWTQIFMDLEKTLPPNARVVSIKPTVSPTEDVDLTLTVAAASMGPLVEFVKKLEGSPQFTPAVNGQRYNSDKTGGGGVTIDVTTRYRQEHLGSVPPDASPVGGTAVLQPTLMNEIKPGGTQDIASKTSTKIRSGEETP